MKKVFVIMLAAVLPLTAFAQTFSVSGEAKSGIYWESVEDRLGNDDSHVEKVKLGSVDDAGNGSPGKIDESNTGRFRINMEYANAAANMGFKARLNWENFNNAPVNGPGWGYGFGWGSFFDDQFVVSIGKLGASPWGTGGPEMWRELENGSLGGLRFEWKPAFVPGELNLGFVLNSYNDAKEVELDREINLMDLLKESVIGVSYKNDWFMARVAYRFDSEVDNRADRSGTSVKIEGDQLVYRLEEYALREVVPDMSIWALGFFDGIGSEAPEITFMSQNWIFVQYAPPEFTALVRFGLDVTENRFVAYAKPSFAYNFFDGLLVPSIGFGIANDFGEHKIVPDSAYSYFEIEPKIQVNFVMGAYVAFSYYFRLENAYAPPYPPEKQTQYINLRAGVTF